MNFRVDQRYVGSRDAGLEAPVDPKAQRTSPYFEADAAVSLDIPRASFRIFVRNLFNSSAASAVRELANTSTGALRLIPRTLGLQVRYSF